VVILPELIDQENFKYFKRELIEISNITPSPSTKFLISSSLIVGKILQSGISETGISLFKTGD